MLRPIDEYFSALPEPQKSCMEYLRMLLSGYNIDLTEEWKYRMPMYYYKGKMFCYLWIHKTHKYPYIGFIDGLLMDEPLLIQEKRARIKILPIDPLQDIPVETITELLSEATALRDNSTPKNKTTKSSKK